jgi:hypothetical protein
MIEAFPVGTIEDPSLALPTDYPGKNGLQMMNVSRALHSRVAFVLQTKRNVRFISPTCNPETPKCLDWIGRAGGSAQSVQVCRAVASATAE